MKYTIIYVFGQKSEYETYNNDNIVSFVKIGETTIICNSIDDLTPEKIKTKALERCRQETRTGLPFICKIFDCFIFPYKIKTDDIIRTILCEDVYDLENSRNNNKSKDDDDIAAGKEFVYNVKHSNIVHAVESYDHELFTSCNLVDLEELQKICKINTVGCEENINILSTNEIEKNKTLTSRKENFRFSLISMTIGDKVKFIYDDSIIAEVCDDKHVVYENEIYSLTALSRKFMPKKYSIYAGGPEYFTNLDGVNLQDLRNN